jgi:hypothetical protein
MGMNADDGQGADLTNSALGIDGKSSGIRLIFDAVLSYTTLCPNEAFIRRLYSAIIPPLLAVASMRNRN